MGTAVCFQVQRKYLRRKTVTPSVLSNNPTNPDKQTELYERIRIEQTKGYSKTWEELSAYQRSVIHSVTSELVRVFQDEIAAYAAAVERDVAALTQQYFYVMPPKSVRSRTTAFKLYATKFFNSEIKKRKERFNVSLAALNKKYGVSE